MKQKPTLIDLEAITERSQALLNAKYVDGPAAGEMLARTSARDVPSLIAEVQRLRAIYEAPAVIEAAADWLESQRDQTWNGSERRRSNYGRAASDLRRYAKQLGETA